MKLKTALLMLLPVILIYIFSFLIPMILVGQLSFLSTMYTGHWVGIENYIKAFQDKYFLKAFENSFWFVLMIAPLKLIFSYSIASFLTGFDKRVQAVGRFILYIPSLISGLIMTLIWGWFLQRNGLINQFLAMFNIAAIPWLGTPWTARLSISMIIIVSGLGFYVILFSASMMSINPELKDAAKIDGANDRQYKRYIVFPIMIPTVLLALLLIIVGVMQMWETIYVLTGEGGPGGSTASPVYDIFQSAFRFGKPALAAAKGIILMVVIAGILLLKRQIEKWLKL